MAEFALRPGWRFLVSHPAHFIALGGGAGLAPFAPGTWGTLLAFPLHWLIASLATPGVHVLVLVALFALGVWACAATGRALGAPDHGSMVWDEIVAFLLVLCLAPPLPLWQACAFLLFRLFDILKPAPIRHYDRNIRNGFGVMLDDLIAAFYALLCLAAWRFVFE